jgi:hypothetical protein
MPLPKREPLPTIIRMRVINPKAARYPEEGWIVDTEQGPHLMYITLLFEEDGKPERYERSELEIVMP